MVVAWVICACIVVGERGKVGAMRSASAEPATPATAVTPPTTDIQRTQPGTEVASHVERAAGADAGSQAVTAAPGELAADAGADLDAGAVVEPACSEEMAQVGRFCVDRYEAHLVTADADGVLRPFSHSQRPQPGVRYEARSAPGMFPQGYISRVESLAACKNAGKRLCSMNEWRRACQGSRWAMYPYGNSREAGRCNSGKAHLLQARFGSNAALWKYDEHFNNPRLNEEPGFLARSGEHEECTGETSIFDMVGNLHEWVSDRVDSELVRKMDEENISRHKQPWHEGNGVFLGGFFSTGSELGPGCKYITYAHEPAYHDYSTGFRCCATAKGPAPEPERGKSRGGKPGKRDPIR